MVHQLKTPVVIHKFGDVLTAILINVQKMGGAVGRIRFSEHGPRTG